MQQQNGWQQKQQRRNKMPPNKNDLLYYTHKVSDPYLNTMDYRPDWAKKITKKDKLDIVIKRLDAIEKKIDGFIGLQLINGIWR